MSLSAALCLGLGVEVSQVSAAGPPSPPPTTSTAVPAMPPPPAPLANSLPVHTAQCSGAAAAGLATGAPLGFVASAVDAGLAVAFDGSCWAALGDLIGAGIGAAANAAIGAVAQWVTAGAANAATLLLTSLQHEAGAPNLSAPWFTSMYYGAGSGAPGALTVAAWLMVLVVTGSLLVSIIRGDLGGMVRLLALRLPVAILVSYLAIWLVTALLSLTDVAAGWMLQRGIASLDQWVGMLDMQSQGNSIGTDLLTVLACLGLLLATLLSYVELIARDAGIYIVTAFIPLIAVASLWPGAHSALKKGAETLFVLGAAKFVIVFVLVLGAGALTGASNLHDYSGLLDGLGIFLIAALAPAAIFRLVPVLEGAAVGALAGGAGGWAVGRASPLLHRGASGLRAGSHGVAAAAGAAVGGSGSSAALSARAASPSWTNGSGGGTAPGTGSQDPPALASGGIRNPGGGPPGNGGGPILAGTAGAPSARRAGGGGGAAPAPISAPVHLRLAGSNDPTAPAPEAAG
ncbi:MAG: hypothetical protein JF886_09420 [Candidatus Dormibacteraeota bacterium]|uniref:Type IV secretion system protein TrbL n=1 Tax=Candidatus Aeolococcus gillhamiae TaxID=3127015 RepID=A0A934JU69_9BACT|nr:hypothetical protein [Candidatus Dormibacteraeota bacterium]